MLYTNVTPGDLANSGTQLPNGITNAERARAIADVITAAPGSEWAEITDSAPTPAELQPYAGDITSPAQASSTAGLFLSLYYTGDDGSAGYRAFRFRLQGGSYIYLDILDTGATGATWHDTPVPNSTDAAMLALRAAYLSSNNDRILLCMGDGWIAPMVWDVPNGRLVGGKMVWAITPPADAHWQRGDIAAITATNFYSPVSNVGNSIAGLYTGIGSGGVIPSPPLYSVQTYAASIWTPARLDMQERLLAVPALAVLNRSEIQAILGHLPHLRLAQPSLATFGDNVEVDGKDFLCIGSNTALTTLVQIEA